jgi:hypothetical protein
MIHVDSPLLLAPIINYNILQLVLLYIGVPFYHSSRSSRGFGSDELTLASRLSMCLHLGLPSSV